MLKIAIAGLAISGLALAIPNEAHAQSPLTRPCPFTESGAYACDPGVSALIGGRQPTGTALGGSGTQAATDIEYVLYKRISVDANGSPCIESRYVPRGTPARPNFGLPDTEQTSGSVSGLYETAPPCPPSASEASSSAVTPYELALGHWARIPLPRPRPAIAPGRAITGKLAYLETAGQTTHVYRADTVFGLLEITAAGSHYVDWGDGETTGPYATEGTPWPNGNITHEYGVTGWYDVVVTTRWTATWRLGEHRGPLPPNETLGRIDDFPVQEIQAVVGR